MATTTPTIPTVEGAPHVLKTPVWVLVVRVFQIIISIVILGLAAWIINGAYIDSAGLSLAVSVLTWVVVLYSVLTEKVASIQQGYHIIAVMCLDGFLIIMWLAAWAATAAERAAFVIPTTVNGCYDDGSLISSNFCFKKRSLEKRGVILFKSGADAMSAVAGLGALMWILFIAVFAWTVTMFVRGRKQGLFSISVNPGENQTESQAAGQAGEPKPAPQPTQGTELYYQQQQQQPQYQQPQYQQQQQPQYQQPQYQQPQYQQPQQQPGVSPLNTTPGPQQQPVQPSAVSPPTTGPAPYPQEPYQPPAQELQNSQVQLQPPPAPPVQYGQPQEGASPYYPPTSSPPPNNQ